MKKIFLLIWKNKILVIILIFVFVLVFLFETKKPQEIPTTVTPTLLPSQGESYQELTPGISTEEEINKKLGGPIEETSQGEKIISEYKSTNPTINHQVIYEEQTAVFIKEIVSFYDDKLMSDLEKKHGKAPYILYKKSEANSGFFLYVHPEKGVAYIANPNGGVLLEIWYFIPTTIDKFKEKWAKEYSENFPFFPQ